MCVRLHADFGQEWVEHGLRWRQAQGRVVLEKAYDEADVVPVPRRQQAGDVVESEQVIELRRVGLTGGQATGGGVDRAGRVRHLLARQVFVGELARAEQVDGQRAEGAHHELEQLLVGRAVPDDDGPGLLGDDAVVALCTLSED